MMFFITIWDKDGASQPWTETSEIMSQNRFFFR
jgi:hypothetical protein